MQLSFTQKKHIRKNFGKLIEGLSIPNLIEVQKNSYNEFLKSKSDSFSKKHKYKFNFKQFVREILGYHKFHFLRKLIQGNKSEFRRNEKSFKIKEVKLIINKLNKIASTEKIVKVNEVLDDELQIPKLFSKKTIKVFT